MQDSGETLSTQRRSRDYSYMWILLKRGVNETVPLLFRAYRVDVCVGLLSGCVIILLSSVGYLSMGLAGCVMSH